MKSIILVSYMLISTILITELAHGGFGLLLFVINIVFIGPTLWEKLKI